MSLPRQECVRACVCVCLSHASCYGNTPIICSATSNNAPVGCHLPTSLSLPRSFSFGTIDKSFHSTSPPSVQMLLRIRKQKHSGTHASLSHFQSLCLLMLSFSLSFFLCVSVCVCVCLYVTAVVLLSGKRMCEHCVGTSGYIMKLTHTHTLVQSHTHIVTHVLRLLCSKLKWCVLLLFFCAAAQAPIPAGVAVVCSALNILVYSHIHTHTHTHTASFWVLFLSVTTGRATRCGHNSWAVSIYGHQDAFTRLVIAQTLYNINIVCLYTLKMQIV